MFLLNLVINYFSLARVIPTVEWNTCWVQQREAKGRLWCIWPMPLNQDKDWEPTGNQAVHKTPTVCNNQVAQQSEKLRLYWTWKSLKPLKVFQSPGKKIWIFRAVTSQHYLFWHFFNYFIRLLYLKNTIVGQNTELQCSSFLLEME